MDSEVTAVDVVGSLVVIDVVGEAVVHGFRFCTL